MANLAAGGMKGLGVTLGVDGADANKIEQAYEEVTKFKLTSDAKVQSILSADSIGDRTVSINGFNIKADVLLALLD